MTGPNDPSPNTFALEIAGLGARGFSNSPALAQALASRYRDFPLKGIPRLEIHIQRSGQERAAATLDTGMKFENGELVFDAPGYRGNIQESAGKGRLDLSSAQPLEDSSYFVRVAYALLAFQAGGLMLHAAGVVRQGKAYLFFGHSGSGKTTVARLSTGSTVLNDDLVLLLPAETGWQVYGTPFWNPSQVRPTADHAPLAKMFRLAQDRTVFLEEIRGSQALAELAANIPIIPADPLRGAELLKRLQTLLRAAPVKRLHFLPDSSFWDVISSGHE